MKILITGATGFIGKHLVRTLSENQHELHLLSRNAHKVEQCFSYLNNDSIKYFSWDPISELPPTESFKDVDAIISLMGENVASKRWSQKQKDKIYDSRVVGTRNLVEAINNYTNHKIETFISTSAVGFYDVPSNDVILDEDSKSGEGFLQKVCRDWEVEAVKAKNCRTAIIRVGAPLGADGGMLLKMLPIFKLGLGGKLGSGLHYWAWIHIKDLIKMYNHILTDSRIDGIINGVGPNPATNLEFTKIMGQVLNRPTFFSVPKIAINLAMGEMGEIALSGQRVISKRIQDFGYEYEYKTLESCLKDLLS